MTSIVVRAGDTETGEPETENDQSLREDTPKLEPTLDLATGWLMALFGMFLGSRAIRDNSFLTHLATGDLSRTQGGIPSIDPYSYTASGADWTVQSWFASLVYSLLDDVGGVVTIQLFNGALVGLVMLMLWKLTDSARPLLARVLVLVPVMVIGDGQWSPRPLLFGLLGFIVLLQVLQEQRSVGWLIPVMWVWVNSHGSFPIAFVLIGAFGLGRMIDQRTLGGKWELPQLELRVLKWTLLGLGLSMINPLGPRLLIFPARLLANQEALEGVSEWASPDFDSLAEKSFLALIIGLFVVSRLGARWRLIIPGILFAVSGLLAMRNLSLASIVLLVAIAPSLQFKGSLRGHERGFLPRALIGLVVAGAVLGSIMVRQNETLSLALYPVEEIDWLEERGLIAEPGVNIVQRDYVGNYMDYRFGSEARVFMDDRFDFFPQQVLDDHRTFIRGGDYSEALERYEANVILWQNEDGFAAWLAESDAWAVAYESENWLIALPANSPHVRQGQAG